jgi:hypothetical protein
MFVRLPSSVYANIETYKNYCLLGCTLCSLQDCYRQNTEASVKIYQTKLNHFLEDGKLHTRHRKDLRSRVRM